MTAHPAPSASPTEAQLETARILVSQLPPDVLMHPMPFPSRLDYAAKIAAPFIANSEARAVATLAQQLAESLAREKALREVWSAAKEVRLNIASMPYEHQRTLDHNGWVTELRRCLNAIASTPPSAKDAPSTKET